MVSTNACLAILLVGLIAQCHAEVREGKRVAGTTSGIATRTNLASVHEAKDALEADPRIGYGGNFECGGGSYIEGKRAFLDKLVQDGLRRPVKYKKNGRTHKHYIRWTDCCEIHDIEGYCGGTKEQFKASNEKLRRCMIRKWEEAKRITGRKLGWHGVKVKAIAKTFSIGLPLFAARVWPVPRVEDRPAIVSKKRAEQLVEWYKLRQQTCVCGGHLPTPLRYQKNIVNVCCQGPLRDPHSLNAGDPAAFIATRAAWSEQYVCKAPTSA